VIARDEGPDRLGTALAAVSAIVPALFAAAGAPGVPDAAHDEPAIRALGWGFTGAWRALDAPVAALAAWLPLGTRAARASLVGACLAGALAYVAFLSSRRLLARAGARRGLGAVLACVAALSAGLAPPVQTEAIAPAGSVLGALLALAPLVCAVEPVLLALLVGLAAGYEPLVGAAALAGAVGQMHVEHKLRGPWPRALVARMGAAFALGLAPLLLAVVLARRRALLSSGARLFAHALGERGAAERVSLSAFAREELGWVPLALLAIGAGATLWTGKSRAPALVLLAPVAIGAVALVAGAPAGPTRYAPAVLAALVACLVFVGAGMERLARAVAEAPVPFARASAAMIVVLELALPVRLADEAFGRCEERARGLPALWDEVAWGDLPPGAIMLVRDPATMRRVVAARALGSMRPDVAIVPLFDLSGRLGSRELSREPKLAPFWRDLALGMAPEEFSLSVLAQSRPLVLPYDVKWDRALARHLVPAGLVTRYEPEPRGQSDRRKALEDFTPERERLQKAVLSPKDSELAAVTAHLLRVRLVSLAAAGERDIIGRGLDDLRPFSPDDPLASQIVRRVVTTKGPIEVRDLDVR
jgi:hypothetical protein